MQIISKLIEISRSERFLYAITLLVFTLYHLGIFDVLISPFPLKDIFVDEDLENSTLVNWWVGTLVVLYLFISVIIMLNFLIAMLNSSYQRIQENIDLEWKFNQVVFMEVSRTIVR